MISPLERNARYQKRDLNRASGCQPRCKISVIQDAQNMQQVRKALKLVAPLPIVWATGADCARALLDFTTYHLSNSLQLPLQIGLDALQDAEALIDVMISSSQIRDLALKLAVESNHSFVSIPLPGFVRFQDISMFVSLQCIQVSIPLPGFVRFQD